MRATIVLCMMTVAVVCGCATVPRQDTVTMSVDVLKDKIKGAWAAQVIGVTFGTPVEFQYNGTMIQDYQEIPWYDGYIKETYEKDPGAYDDIYMDLTFVQVLEDEPVCR
jgi:hypothetical protein